MRIVAIKGLVPLFNPCSLLMRSNIRFHTEGRILTTLFGLLFWDVLFAPIPGAFETPYQTAPLDIAEDTFFFSREELIRARISEIQQGRAREIVEGVDDKHREKGTWCVGVRWDLFEKQDLLEIVDVSLPCRCLLKGFKLISCNVVLRRQSPLDHLPALLRGVR